jgi:hypothetical protein
MRVLMTVEIPTEPGNLAIKDGRLGKVIESVFSDINPEAVYFTTRSGNRTAYIVFDLEDASRLPVVAEPFFTELGAKVDLTPVMNREDLAAGLSNLR